MWLAWIYYDGHGWHSGGSQTELFRIRRITIGGTCFSRIWISINVIAPDWMRIKHGLVMIVLLVYGLGLMVVLTNGLGANWI